MAVDLSACNKKEVDRILISSCNGDFTDISKFVENRSTLRENLHEFCADVECNLLNNCESEDYL